MFRSRRPALPEFRAIERLTHELQLFAGELSGANTDDVRSLWVIRALLDDAIQRIDAHVASVPLLNASNIGRPSPIQQDAFAEAVDGVGQERVTAVLCEPCSKQAVPTSCGDSRINRALDYIRTHSTRPSLALADVSDFVRMSRWHLSRLFTRHLGMGFRDLVRELRMQKATALLGNSLLSVKEIAAQLGFAHSTEFDRQFKQSFGLTPTEWRAKQTERASIPRRYNFE